MNCMDPNFNPGLLHNGTCVTPIHLATLDITMNRTNYWILGINPLEVLSQFSYTLKNWAEVQGKTEISATHRGFGTGACIPKNLTYDLTF